MVCRNCGNILLRTDKFCSNCGKPAPVVVPKDEDLTIGYDLPEEEGRSEINEIKVEPPVEKFDWNVHTFPGQDPKPTEEADFDWNVAQEKVAKGLETDEIAFSPEPEVTPNPFDKRKDHVTKHVSPILEPEIILEKEETAAKTQVIDAPQTITPKAAATEAVDAGRVKIPSAHTVGTEKTLELHKTPVPKYEPKAYMEKQKSPKEEVIEAPHEREPVRRSFFRDLFGKRDSVQPEGETPPIEVPEFMASNNVVVPEVVLKAIDDAKQIEKFEAIRPPAQDNIEDEGGEHSLEKSGETPSVPAFAGPAIVKEARGPSFVCEGEKEEKADQRADAAEKAAPVGPAIVTYASGPAFMGGETEQKEDFHKDTSVEIASTVVNEGFQENLHNEAEVPEVKEETAQEKLEKEIFAEANEYSANPMLARHTAKIDKFYTFNKKNEEFQKLLDQEYEKFKEADPVPPCFGPDSEECRYPSPKEEDIPIIEAESQVEEMAKARELFFADDPQDEILKAYPATAVEEEQIEAPEVEVSTDESVAPAILGGAAAPSLSGVTENKEIELSTEEEQIPAFTGPAMATVGARPEYLEEKLEKPQAKEGEMSVLAEESATQPVSPQLTSSQSVENNEESKDVIAPWLEPKNKDLKGKSTKGGKVLVGIIGILIVVLMALVLLLAIRFFAPESGIAKTMDRVTNKVLYVFRGEAQHDKPKKEQVNGKEPAEDKTGLIQMEIEKNAGGSIGAIRYNSSLIYDGSTKYPNADIQNATKLVNNIWYKDTGGTEHYLDRNIVGSAITYASKAAEANKDSWVFNTLDIGEIRKGDRGYYVWVGEYITDKNGTQTSEKKIYLVTENGENMKVAEEFKI